MAANIFTGATNSNWGTNTNWSLGSVPTNADGNVATFNVTSPNCTVDASARFANNIDFTGFAATITMTNTISISSGGTANFTGMTNARVTGAAALILLGSVTITAATATWGGALNYTTSGTKTMTGTLTVTGLLTSATTTQTCNGGTIVANGGITVTGAFGGGGTTLLTIGGGTWSGAGALSLATTFAGNSTISGSVVFTTATLTYSSGTITTTSSTVTLSTTASTLNCNSANCVFNNITVTITGCTLSADLNLSGTLSINLAACTINGSFNINLSGASSAVTVSGTSVLSGAVTLVLKGSTTVTTGTGGIACNLTINSTGTPVFSGTVKFGGTLTYTTAVAVTTTSSTLQLYQSATLNCSAVTWNNITFSGAAQTFTFSADVTATGLCTISATGSTTFTGAFNLNIGGGITHSGASTTTGSTTFVINGTGTWSSTSSTCIIGNNLTVNITSGTLTFGTTVCFQGATLHWTSGTVDCTTNSNTFISAATTTFDSSVTTAHFPFVNVQLNGTSQTYTFNASWTITGLLTIGGLTACTLTGAFTLTCVGFTNSAVLTTSGTLALKMTGGTWTGGATAVLRNNMEFAGNITISANIAFNTGTLKYTSGTIDTTTNSSTLNITATGTTLDVGSMSWFNITVSPTGSTTTLSSALICTGTLTLTGTQTFSGSFNISCGSLTMATSASVLTTSGTITGTGTLSTGAATTSTFNSGQINWSGTVTIGINWAGSALLNISGTTTVNGATTASIISMSMTWASGTITTSTGFVYRTNIFTISSGVTISFSSTLTLNTSATLTCNASGITINTISCGGTTTQTINGTNGITIGTLQYIGSTATPILSLKSNNTYTITTSFTTTTATAAVPWLIQSSTGGVQAILTVNQGVIIDLGFVNATDINSSGGLTVWSYRGTLTNATNWKVLPTQPITLSY